MMVGLSYIALADSAVIVAVSTHAFPATEVPTAMIGDPMNCHAQVRRHVVRGFALLLLATGLSLTGAGLAQAAPAQSCPDTQVNVLGLRSAIGVARVVCGVQDQVQQFQSGF